MMDRSTLVEAFARWERDYRDRPGAFARADQALERGESVTDSAELCADTLLSYIEQVNAYVTVGPPDLAEPGLPDTIGNELCLVCGSPLEGPHDEQAHVAFARELVALGVETHGVTSSATTANPATPAAPADEHPSMTAEQAGIPQHLADAATDRPFDPGATL